MHIISSGFILLIFEIFNLEPAKVIKIEPIDYNMEVDKTLEGIENAVRNQSSVDFMRFFSESFDAEDWYRKFMGKLTPDQAATYSLSRFGDVKEGKLVQFTESIRLNDTVTRRTPFNAALVQSGSGQENTLLIESLTVHDETPSGEQDI